MLLYSQDLGWSQNTGRDSLANDNRRGLSLLRGEILLSHMRYALKLVLSLRAQDSLNCLIVDPRFNRMLNRSRVNHMFLG